MSATELIAALREHDAKMTPGEWVACHRHSCAQATDDELAGLGWEIEGPPEPSIRGQYQRASDAQGIAFLRNALPEIIAALEDIRRLNEYKSSLVWESINGGLRASHPYYHDEGKPLCYRVEEVSSGVWQASFGVWVVTTGPLIEVLRQVQIDAHSPVGIPVALQEKGGAA